MMIQSILDTDLYKFTQMNAVITHFPNLRVRYKFIDRNNITYPENFAHDLNYELRTFQDNVWLTDDEYEYLKKLDYLPRTFLDFLRSYRFDVSELSVTQDNENKLHISIEGYWYKTILWEVVLMAMISELYFKRLREDNWVDDVWSDKFQESTKEKADLLVKHNAYYADFGTRRRYSFNNQDRVVQNMIKNGKHCFVGTSNVHLAKEYNIKPIGTLAHEWFMVIGALYGYKMANIIALDLWSQTYEGDLGIALSDTYTSDVFLRSFTKRFAKLFDGVRHDSGDPYIFTNKVIAHYKSLGIDPMSKVIIFSDGLNPQLATEIKEYCASKIKCSFGIGTNFSNDVGVKPLNIVIKISEVYIEGFEWVPAVKLSDNIGKNTGDQTEVDLCKQILRIKE